MVKNSKKKGNDAEKQFSQLLRDQGVDNTASRNYSSGNNTQKSDVHNKINYNIEVKHVERLNIYKAIEQSIKDSQKTHATPLVAFRKNRMDWWVAIPAWKWCDLERRSHEPKLKAPDKDLLWKLKSLKELCNQIIKLIK